MIQILWHGRGGQGAFTAAKLLGAAYSLKNNHSYALSFPSFGPERRGAPIRAFTKLDVDPIGDRSEIEKADFTVYLDDTLFNAKNPTDPEKDGIILINTKKEFTDPGIVTIDADSLALKILGRPIANTVMLGALCALYDGIDESDIQDAISLYMERRLQEKNIAVVHAAAEYIKETAEGGRA